MAHIKKYDVLAPKAAELMRTNTATKTAELLGVSATRLRAIMAKAKRDASMPEWTQGLDIRIANALIAAGFRSKDHVCVAVCYGEDIPRIRGVRLEILKNWLS